MPKQRILFLSVSAGAGHVRAANALEAYANLDERVESLHLDVMNYVPKIFRKIYADTYIYLVQTWPNLWGILYKRTNQASPKALSQRLRRCVERLNTKSLLKAIHDFSPDAVVCTHFLPAEILMHQINKREFNAPVWVQVTDFDLHQMWLIPQMQGYFVASDEVAFRLHGHGIDHTRVHVTGIPVMPAFAAQHNKAAYLKNYGLAPDKLTLLLMGGGAGVGGLDLVAKQLLAQDGDFQLIALAGKNEKALNALNKLTQYYPNKLFPQGFTHTVEELMACADLNITKPGGLTTSECLAMGLPMIVHSPIPGQEEHNADYLLEQGAALKAIDHIGLTYRVNHILKQPEQLEQMRVKAKELGKPHAGKHVLDIVLNQIC